MVAPTVRHKKKMSKVSWAVKFFGPRNVFGFQRNQFFLMMQYKLHSVLTSSCFVLLLTRFVGFMKERNKTRNNMCRILLLLKTRVCVIANRSEYSLRRERTPTLCVLILTISNGSVNGLHYFQSTYQIWFRSKIVITKVLSTTPCFVKGNECVKNCQILSPLKLRLPMARLNRFLPFTIVRLVSCHPESASFTFVHGPFESISPLDNRSARVSCPWI